MKRTLKAVLLLSLLPLCAASPGPRETHVALALFDHTPTTQTLTIPQFDGSLSSVTLSATLFAEGSTTHLCARDPVCGAGCFRTTLLTFTVTTAPGFSLPQDVADDEVSPPMAFGTIYEPKMAAATKSMQILVDPTTLPAWEGTGTVSLTVDSVGFYQAAIGCDGEIEAGGVAGQLVLSVTYNPA